jgi:hypothetical protein
MAAYTELEVDQGADFSYSIDIVGDDGAPINVASYVFAGQIRKSYYSSNATANLTMVIDDVANGIVKITMNAATSANVAAGRYLYDVKMVDSTNTTSRLVEGIITFNPQVTR